MKTSRSLQWTLALSIFVMAVLPVSASAQVPPRFYWKNLVGGNAIPVIYMNMNGNANPLDPSYLVTADGQFSADVVLAGYAKTFTVFGRPAMAATLLPMGRLDGEATLFNQNFHETASGYGDPILEFDINLIGPPPIKNIPDAMRYEPGFSMDLLVDVILPVGEYDSDKMLNLGLNRWYGRIASPIVWQLGDWVPGRRTTLEFIPSIWVFGDNDDFLGRKLSTDPKFQLETHLTRDFHPDFWGSLDVNWMNGGQSSVDGIEGEALNMVALGFTLGYHINENIQVTAGYMATVNDGAPTDLRMDGFKLSLVFGWHPLVEGMKRLGSN